MGAPTIRALEASPLSRLAGPDRAQLIALINAQFSPREAVTLLSALAGTRDEAAALPRALQLRLQRAILNEFPVGHAAAVVSRLGVARAGSSRWVDDLRERTAHEDVAALAKAIEHDVGRAPNTTSTRVNQTGSPAKRIRDERL